MFASQQAEGKRDTEGGIVRRCRCIFAAMLPIPPTAARSSESASSAAIIGEIKYHDYFGHEGDILMAEIGHYESEQYTKEIFYSIIRDLFPNFALQLSKINTNPIKYL